MINRNLNGSAIEFDQDGKIHFEEIGHTYTVEGVGNMTPVSTVVGKFFKEFDALYWSLKKCKNNPLEAEKLREKWESMGAMASQGGTHLHRQIELYLNTKQAPQLTCTATFSGKHIQCSQAIDISREWSYFKAFEANVEFTPFRTEWCVYDTDARIAGTVDLICSCPDGTYEIYDWKRSSKIDPKEINRFANGINGLEHLTDTSYSHYCLQQNIYRHIIEKNYGLKISAMHLVVLHESKQNYELVKVPRMEFEVETIIHNLPYI